MSFKKISLFRTPAGCVLLKFGQLWPMEVCRFCSWATLCALLSGATFLGAANLSPNPSTTTTSGTNVARAALPTQAFDLDDQHKIRPGDKLSFRVAEDREEA